MNPQSIIKHKAINVLQSCAILSGMIALTALLGWFVAGPQGIKWAIGLSIVIFLFSPRISPYLVLRLYRAVRLPPHQMPVIYDALEQLAHRANLPATPNLYYIPSSMPNAFTMGNRREAAIALTDGLLKSLNLRELIGVLAHEVSHIRNNDMWIMNLSDIVSRVTSIFSMTGQFLVVMNLPLLLFSGYQIPWLPILTLIFAPSLMLFLQLALSRSREFDADLNAAMLTGDPEGLASALVKIEQSKGGFFSRIFFPGHREPNPSVLRTHPDTEKRVKRLLSFEEKKPRYTPIDALMDEDIFYHPESNIVVRRNPRWRFGGIWY
ncbi:MAG: M48 family metalloprotease [Deltaproteobacteria bacterium]|nr:M48 family metalloprotease [Deltaproteobacteria bacterium]MBW1963082.1 M48 family metalloprotease [Deltaproteobacteria bacterium]MBW1993972.1 M48 family metalloprotease [Deltaproteobacteria bacterium]MBW2154253.1 M48 family metalloprotease [Deltaproteobacteria bacterium]